MKSDGTTRPEPHVEPGTAPPQGAAGPGAAGALATGAATLLVGLLLARLQGFGAVDDAFITLRYSANWGRGVGLVFNPGEVVEGFSTFLLVALQAGLVRVGLDPVVAMTLLGWGSLAALGATAFVFFGMYVLAGRPWVTAAVTVALLANPMVVAWASSGESTWTRRFTQT